MEVDDAILFDEQLEPPAVVGVADPLVVVEDADDEAEEGDVSVTESEDNSTNPWPYLIDFFLFVSRKGDNVTAQCCLCRPKSTVLKAHVTSLSNLRAHMTRKHGEQLMEFDKIVKTSRQSRKRQSETPTSPSPFSPVQKKQQLLISSWGQTGSVVAQKAVDRKIVAFFVDNMLPFQVLGDENI